MRAAIRFTAALLLLAAPAAAAQERILSYDSEVDIRADGSLDVTERIRVRAEGNQIRRGIYRDYPTRYRDRYGNRVRVDLDVLGVERNGRPEPWFTERLANGIRINTGNDDLLPVPAEYTFTLRYRTTRQIGFFKNHDELYWNAIGTGWIFAIESGTVAVRLPRPVPVGMGAEAYTGPQGARGNDYRIDVQPEVVRYQLTRSLTPYEGFTIVLTFPKGLVAEPGTAQRVRWFLRDNVGVLVALVGLVFLAFYTLREWRRVGRDPQKGIIIARYEPPEGQTPASVKFLKRMGYDTRCFTADVLALAIGGHLRIETEDKLFKDEWRLERDGTTPTTTPAASQQALLASLFPGEKTTLVLKNKNAGVLSKARAAHMKSLERQMQPRYFKRNTSSVVKAVLIAIVAGVGGVALSGGFGILAIIAMLVVMLVIIIVFARLVRAPTREGRALLDEIEGLKLYMSVAERDELGRVRGLDEPLLDDKRYQELLPYAVALEVENEWTDKFTRIAGAAAVEQATRSMHWYRGSSPITNLGAFSNSIGSSLNSTISSASTPPGSSSGAGGGGSSGGGGGGGGGGGR